MCSYISAGILSPRGRIDYDKHSAGICSPQEVGGLEHNCDIDENTSAGISSPRGIVDENTSAGYLLLMSCINFAGNSP